VAAVGTALEVGDAIARSGLDRGEVFVTSKLSNDAHEPGDARQAFGRARSVGVSNFPRA
jgi:2,5-diketo-D-gluconate reductase A